MAKMERKSWKPEDVAVIGLACRLPGSASNEAKLWELLAERKCQYKLKEDEVEQKTDLIMSTAAHSKVPKERYNVDAFHQQGATHSNNLSADGGHYLEQDIKSFDAPFFNITTKEAKAMDPQARMLLECSYEAWENAGLSLESIRGSDTGCYVGCFNRDYHELLVADAENSPEYSVTGTGFSLLSNRLSWYYDLKGPSKSEDTACSSSLVALDSAYKSLLRGESKMAMVCGANLMLSPNVGLWLSKLNMLSSEGLSRSFAEGVNGYGRGEGIATVILKPLADALRDGDTIRAVINGTGVNQDGSSSSITLLLASSGVLMYFGLTIRHRSHQRYHRAQLSSAIGSHRVHLQRSGPQVCRHWVL
jgi:zearalenone synthase (highly reducing iterative type I polyketide synthase)